MDDAPFPTTFAHVALTVSDLQRSVEWYTALFGEAPFHVGEMLRGTPHHYSLAVWREPNLGLHCFEGDPRRALRQRARLPRPRQHRAGVLRAPARRLIAVGR